VAYDRVERRGEVSRGGALELNATVGERSVWPTFGSVIYQHRTATAPILKGTNSATVFVKTAEGTRVKSSSWKGIQQHT
jgi:hypothetical protein